MSTNIEWTKGMKTAEGISMQGKTWNPTVGCTEISAGCRDCYAAKMAWRITHMKNKDYQGTVKKLDNGKVVWTGKVNILEHRLLEPVQTKKPTTWFPDSMSDLFHQDIPFEFIDKVFAVMMLCPQHIFQVLTKRTERMYEYMKSRQDFDWIDEAAAIIVMDNPHLFHVVEKYRFEEGSGEFMTNELLPHLKQAYWSWDKTYSEHGKEVDLIYEGDWPSKHIWFGTSIENQKEADKRGEPLYKLHQMGCVTWVSNEPAIGPVNWEQPFYFGFLDWMVTGGESGSTARPMNPEWARASRDFCSNNKIAWFFKQWGQHTSQITDININRKEDFWLCDDGRIVKEESEAFNDPQCETWVGMYTLGKHKTGRLLDGKLHDEYPDLSKLKQ